MLRNGRAIRLFEEWSIRRRHRHHLSRAIPAPNKCKRSPVQRTAVAARALASACVADFQSLDSIVSSLAVRSVSRPFLYCRIDNVRRVKAHAQASHLAHADLPLLLLLSRDVAALPCFLSIFYAGLGDR